MQKHKNTVVLAVLLSCALLVVVGSFAFNESANAQSVNVKKATGPQEPADYQNYPQLLRDITGYPDDQYTDGQALLPIWKGGSSYEMSGTPVTFGQNRTLTRFRGVASDLAGGGTLDGDWPNIQWTVNFWAADATYQTAQEAFDASPLVGNIVDNEPLTESHVPFASDYLVTLVPASAIDVTGGVEYYISIKAEWNGGGNPTMPGFRHSTKNSPLPFDWLRDSTYGLFSYPSLGVVPGRVGFDIVGY